MGLRTGSTTGRYGNVHREAEKGTIFFCVYLFQYLTKTGEFFFIYIKERISYNSVYLILALRILRNNEIETVNTSR